MVWQEPSLAEPPFAEPAFADAESFGHRPWIVTTAAFEATLSGLKDCGKGGTGGWVTGGREGACIEGALAVWANAHVPARRIVKKIRLMNDETLPQQ